MVRVPEYTGQGLVFPLELNLLYLHNQPIWAAKELGNGLTCIFVYFWFKSKIKNSFFSFPKRNQIHLWLKTAPPPKKGNAEKIKIDQTFTLEPCQPHLILFFCRRKEDWGPQEKTRLPERTGPQEATGLPEKMDYLDTIGKAYGKTEKDKRSLDLVHIHGPALWKVKSQLLLFLITWNLSVYIITMT